MITYRTLNADEINRELFRGFNRHQIVTKCRRRVNGEWVIRDDPFIDDWTEDDYQFLVKCLKNTINTGGFVCAAFEDNVLKGFVSVESKIFGGDQMYNDLSSIHVSEEMRGKGIGKNLFNKAKEFAKKLYISAHSAIESQGFYKAMGCVEAKVYEKSHVEKEPFDCQLECEL